MPIFQGHGTRELAVDFAWILFILFCVWNFQKSLPKIGRNMKLIDWFKIWIILLFLPNTTYAFFEIKHLFFIDGVADNPNIYSYIVFGGISLSGLISTIYLNIKLVKLYSKNSSETLLFLIFLSLVHGFGGSAGLLNKFSVDGLVFPPVVLYYLWEIATNPNLLEVAVLTSLFIYCTTLPFFKFQPSLVEG